MPAVRINGKVISRRKVLIRKEITPVKKSPEPKNTARKFFVPNE